MLSSEGTRTSLPKHSWAKELNNNTLQMYILNLYKSRTTSQHKTRRFKFLMVYLKDIMTNFTSSEYIFKSNDQHPNPLINTYW